MRTVHVVLHDLGKIIQVMSLMAVPSLVVCAVFGEWYLAPGFVVMAVVSLALGQVLVRVFKPATRSTPASNAITVALAWAAACALAAIPFYAVAFTAEPITQAAGRFTSFTNALFEATSGLTATGLTMVLDEAELPHTLQWWRSLIEWVGGVGVVLLALIVLDPDEGEEALFTSEDNISTLANRTQHTVRRLWAIFMGYTAASVLGFLAVGLPFWQALNHGMTAIATGGFTVTSDSFVGYGTGPKLMGAAITIVGAVSFTMHYVLLVQRRWRRVATNVQMVSLAVALVLGTAALVGVNAATQDDAMFVDSLFQWVSGWGTCGFYSAKLSNWSQAALVVLVVGMFVGGASGSTTGGIKLKRAALLAKSAFWHLRSKVTGGPEPYRFDGETLPGDEAFQKVQTAAGLASLFLVVLLAGALLLDLMVGDRYTFTSILFDATSALGTVGLTAGMTGPDLYAPAKYVLIVLMYMGRLEVTAVLVLVAAPLWRDLQHAETDESENEGSGADESGADDSEADGSETRNSGTDGS